MLNSLKGIIILVLIGVSISVIQSQENSVNSPIIFKRYETVTSYYRIGEDLLNLSNIEISQREKVGIRLCSSKLPKESLLNATADPFIIAERLQGLAYLPKDIIYLFSKECLKGENENRAIVEVWIMPLDSNLPSHQIALESNRIKFIPMGKYISNRGMKDFKPALKKLIHELKKDSENIGVIWGYFLQKPSSLLQKRVSEASKQLRENNIEAERFLNFYKIWSDEVSTFPADTEPTYPNIYLLKIDKSNKASKAVQISLLLSTARCLKTVEPTHQGCENLDR